MSYIGREPQIGNFQMCDAISVVNNQASYSMQVGGVAVIPGGNFNVIASVNGVVQKAGTSFTTSSSNIIFSENLVTGDVIDFILILGSVLDLGVPSDGTVTTGKIVDSNVTTAKIADNAVTSGKLASGLLPTNTPSFLVTRNSMQSIPNATETVVQFNNEVFDADNKYNTSTHKFTPTVAGKYMLSVAGRMNASEDFDIFTLAIQKNGSTIARVDKRHENNESLAFSIIQEADTDDYFQVSVFQNAGYALNLLGDSAAFTFFQGYKLIGA